MDFVIFPLRAQSANVQYLYESSMAVNWIKFIFARAPALFNAWFIFYSSLALSRTHFRPFFCFIVVAFILRFTYKYSRVYEILVRMVVRLLNTHTIDCCSLWCCCLSLASTKESHSRIQIQQQFSAVFFLPLLPMCLCVSASIGSRNLLLSLFIFQ